MVRERNLLAWHAWHVVALPRSKKLPPLRKLLTKEPRKKQDQQTPEQMKEIAKLWTIALGGKVKTKAKADRNGG